MAPDAYFSDRNSQHSVQAAAVSAALAFFSCLRSAGSWRQNSSVMISCLVMRTNSMLRQALMPNARFVQKVCSGRFSQVRSSVRGKLDG